MKTKQRIYGDFPRLVLILLCSAILLHASLAAQGQAAKLRLIGEEQLEDFEPMAEVVFLAKPKSVAPGQAEFSPILFVSKDGERYTVRAQGAGIRSFQRGQNKQFYRAFHNPSAGTLGFMKIEYITGNDEKRFDRRFVMQTLDGRVLWEVEHSSMADARISEQGTVFLLSQSGLDFSFGASGVYVYDANSGNLLNQFHNPNASIASYVFSNDGNRVVFTYVVIGGEPTEGYPRMHIACMDARGNLLWDVVIADPIMELFTSHRGHLTLYMSDPQSPPEGEIQKELYRRVGLIDENGRILWEVDNPSGARVEIIPSGNYYYVRLYADQSVIWDPTARQEPGRYCLFDPLTHQNLWCKELNELVPRLQEGWVPVDAGSISLDDQWQVVGYCERGYQKKEASTVRSLLVLQNYLSRETVDAHELSGRIHKVVTSTNSELAEVLFWDGRRMLFERTQ